MIADRAGAPTGAADPATRVGHLDWDTLSSQMDDHGCALTGPLLTSSECARLADLYADPGLFRSTIDMERYRFGRGEYRYFDHPLPEMVDGLRQAFYPQLLPIARHWADMLGVDAPWPDTLDEWLEQCHRAGQTKPTPILLRYQAGDWNALHRDLYGDLVFPLQVVIGLNQPGTDFSGGEFLLVEQRPRAQSRGIVRILEQGHGLIFTTRERPLATQRGWVRAPMRHGVNEIRSGTRHTLGLVFHDAA
ncbi:MAG TPA: 2OG-Fe(II) oxygenase [Acidimicrobiales bacterium]|nr:2OG-Fe(II) oxygenase [Acidimicrobiales bacterium]